MRNGLTVFVFNLTDVGQGDGGFACVPGSHKSNFIDKLPPDVRAFERRPPYVVQPPSIGGRQPACMSKSDERTACPA